MFLNDNNFNSYYVLFIDLGLFPNGPNCVIDKNAGSLLDFKLYFRQEKLLT